MRMLSLLLMSWVAVSSFAQKNEYGGIKGIVSTSDGRPAAWVTVTMKSTTRASLTHEDGSFEFKKIKAGSYVLVFSLIGFKEKEVKTKIKAAGENFLQVQLEHTYDELQKVIVSSKISGYVATNPSPSLRQNSPLIEIPQNIQTTSNQLLADQGAISISEAIRTVSGIQKNYGELNDITLNFRGFEGSFNIHRNGLGQYWWNQQEDVAMVEKIEFIKGAAGFIVSNFPPGGFLNIITKQPQRETIASVNVEYGSFNLFRLTTDWGGAFSKKSKFTYRFNAGTHRQNRAFQFSNAKRYFICGAIKYEPGKKTTVTAEYNYMRGKTSGNNYDIPSVNGKMFSLPGNFAIADSKTDNLIAADNYFRLFATHQFNNKWNLNLLLGNIFGKWGQDYFLRADGYIPVTNDTIYRYAGFDDLHTFGGIAQLYLNGAFHTGKNFEHKLFAALDYHVDRATHSWGLSQSKFGLSVHRPDYYVDPDSLKNFLIDHLDSYRSRNSSLYLEDHIKIKDKIIVTLGGRFTHVDNKLIADFIPDYQQHTSFFHFTPRVGLNWLFSDALSVFVVYDQFFNPIYAKNIEHKPFKPLTGYNMETGFKGYFLNKKLSTNISIYRIVANNYSSPDPLNPGYFVQFGQAIHNGIDLDIAGNITPSLSVNANYAYIHARLSKGNAEMVGRKTWGTPDHSANLWLKYKLLTGRLKGFSFGIGYQYMGRRSALFFDDPGENVYLPVYNLLDAAVSYRHHKFTIGLNVYNITNIDYASMGVFRPSFNEWRYTPGEPINFRLSVGVNLVNEKKNNKVL